MHKHDWIHIISRSLNTILWERLLVKGWILSKSPWIMWLWHWCASVSWTQKHSVTGAGCMLGMWVLSCLQVRLVTQVFVFTVRKLRLRWTQKHMNTWHTWHTWQRCVVYSRGGPTNRKSIPFQVEFIIVPVQKFSSLYLIFIHILIMPLGQSVRSSGQQQCSTRPYLHILRQDLGQDLAGALTPLVYVLRFWGESQLIHLYNMENSTHLHPIIM